MTEKRRSVSSVCALVALASLLACSGGDDGGGGGPVSDVLGSDTVDISGTWDASLEIVGGDPASIGGRYSATYTMTQSGDRISGTFSSSQGLSGQISGTMSGRTLTFTLEQGVPCPGTLSGGGTVNASGTSGSGSYSGSSACTPYQEIAWSATRR